MGKKWTRSYVISGKKIINIAVYFVMLTLFLLMVYTNRLYLVNYYKNTFLANDYILKNYLDNTLIQINSQNTNSLYGLYAVLNPKTIINNEMGVIKLYENSKSVFAQIDENAEDNSEILPPAITDNGNNTIKETTIYPENPSSYVNFNEIFIRNETKYEVDIQKLLNEKIVYKKQKGPMVLIIHTHATESYFPTDRDLNDSKNVIKVGDEMEKEFKKQGINVIHDKTHHDQPSFNGSYRKSYDTVSSYLKKYPSISVVLDIHRDAITNSDGSKLKVIAEVDKKKAAQVMFVVGTNAGGLTHPNWKENLKFAIQIQQNIIKQYKNLARPINLRRERFNQSLAPHYVIIEVGGNGNSIDEAVLGGKLVASTISKFIKNTK